MRHSTSKRIREASVAGSSLTPRRSTLWLSIGMPASTIRAQAARARAPRPDHLAAEAEPAIHRTDMDELEQHAIGIAVHDAFDRAVRVVADRVGRLLRLLVELGRIGDELA